MRNGRDGAAARRTVAVGGSAENAKAYVARISELAGVKVDYVSVGPERGQMFEA